MGRYAIPVIYHTNYLLLRSGLDEKITNHCCEKLLTETKLNFYIYATIDGLFKLNKKQQILATALKLFVANGFHGTATAKIAEEAGVANGTLFHHFKTKEELVVGLYISIKEELAASTATISHATEFITPQFKNVYFHTIEWALANRDKFYYIWLFEMSPYRSQISSEAMWKQSIVLYQLITEGIKKKLLQPRPIDLILTIFNSHIFGIYQYLNTGANSQKERELVIYEGYEMIWDMLKFR